VSSSQYSCRYRPELGLVLKDVSMIIVRWLYRAISALVCVDPCPCRNLEKKSVFVVGLEPGSLQYVLALNYCSVQLT
jgi:hypothetical protein